ncbi:hemolysin family protein [Actinopolymorpha sp. B11F2]|uniref:hemolysin family protein n=1 Tax=Actinopolymorpha sp. B11F2 TaxID=3160862 RepID=UPI0032E38FE9
MSTWTALLISAGIIAFSAFFVAVEFALVAARRNRLAEAAATSASARAALKSAQELSLLLAGSQLGITLCTLALGAIAKPAVHHLMTPTLGAWGLPEATADVAAFILSLIVVTFIHLVVGEMAPKSWAISHPEKSATLLALPMRAFMWFTRPLLVTLNQLANWCLHRVGVEPVDELATARTADDLRQLVQHSAKAGALDTERHDQLMIALDLHSRPIRDIVRPAAQMAHIDAAATIEQIKTAARSSGHSRLVVRQDGLPVGMVHVRDTLTAPTDVTAAELMRPVATLTADTPIYTAMSAMRDNRNHLALIHDDQQLLGILTLQDLLNQLLTTPPTSSAATIASVRTSAHG